MDQSNSPPLQTIQRWLQAVITHPDGVRSGVISPEAASILKMTSAEVARVILPSSEMSSLDRLGIYGRAYFGRLLDCLRVQYPAVRHAVGDEAFDALAFGYLVEHPSTSDSLSSLGAAFESHLAVTRPPRSAEADEGEPDFADFVIELARLERVYSDVFDGPGPERVRSLHKDDFAGLTPERFADARLKLHACVRLLECHFPVHEYATAIRRGIEPEVPTPRPVWLVITRRDYVVRRFEITRPQSQLLSALGNGETIGEALALLWGTRTSVDPVDLQNWFREWSIAPLFSELILHSDRD